MPDYKWPEESTRTYLGKRVSRIDGPVKVTGNAKYTYDYNPKGLLYTKVVRSPYAHARLVSLDLSAAEKMPGVKSVLAVAKVGREIQWAGDEIAAVAASDERLAEDAARAIVARYEPLPHHVLEAAEPPKEIPPDTNPISAEDLDDMISNQVPEEEIAEGIKKRGVTFKPTPDQIQQLKASGVDEAVTAALSEAKVRPQSSAARTAFKRTPPMEDGDPDEAFKSAASVTEGVYGMPMITHCCMETHGVVCEWPDPNNLLVHLSTQNVSGIAPQLAPMLKIPASNIRVVMDHIGGAFGSKFGPDNWSQIAADLSRKAGGAPVKLMLERDAELQVAGARPSGYARIKVATDADGKITGWDSSSWNTGGLTGGGAPPLPYIFKDIPNQRRVHTAVVTNNGAARAWRAPNHPQACLLTMSALDDAAAKLKMDPLEFIRKNLDLVGPRAKTYEQEFALAAELIGWKQNWHQRGDGAAGHIKRGLGLSLHTWGGGGHESHCDLSIHPDGAVDVRMCTQDLGTGTRTAIAIVVADTFGIPVEQVKLVIGDSRLPMSGGSGGSTTIGGVSSSTRRAAVDAREQLLAKVAPALHATPEQLEIVGGTVRVKGHPNQSLTWKQACAKLGATSLTVRGNNPDNLRPPTLTSSGVGGVQMADVSVDTETGIVKVNKMVAVQDIGLVVNEKTAESQVLGALIMGISYSLFEEKIMDPITGRMLNPNMEFYRLAGLMDIGELVVRFLRGPEQDRRGAIGLAEPPVISPGAAISNAVANALGVRVPMLPLTPERVLDALEANRAPKSAVGGEL